MSKIDAVFKWAKKQQVTFVDQSTKEKTNNGRNTWDDYAKTIHTFENWCKKEFGVKDITRIRPWQSEAYFNHLCQTRSPFTVNKYLAAHHAFQKLAVESKIYRRMDIGEKAMLKEKVIEPYGLVRKSSESQCLKANQSDYEKVMGGLSESRSKQKAEIMSIHKAQRLFGFRISEAVALRKEDITLGVNGRYVIYVNGKGGQERWVEVFTKEGEAFLKERLEKTARQKDALFGLKYKDGSDKSFKAAVAMVKDAVGKAADRSNAHRDGKRYSSHSGRKVYAQERVNELAKLTKRQLKHELDRRIANFPLDRNGENKLQKKYNSELKELRKKMTNKESRERRFMSHKELCLFLVSVETGHFRINIMRYYADYPGNLSPKE